MVAFGLANLYLLDLTGPLIAAIGLVSAASIVDYTMALWRGRALSGSV